MTAKTADFGGYATKNGLLCSDGRTIMPDAFKHFDGQTVPLVWQHQHDEPINVLGHALLENRPDGVYAYGYFNDSPYGQHAREMVKNGDIAALSIYATKLQQQGGHVLHGELKEVSLVLAGANPGAIIDNVYIKHSDGGGHRLDDAAWIFSDIPLDLELSHSDTSDQVDTAEDSESSAENENATESETANDDARADQVDRSENSDGSSDDSSNTDDSDTVEHADGDTRTIQDVLATFNEEQLNVLNYLLGAAVEDDNQGADVTTDTASSADAVTHADAKTVKDIYDGFSEEEKNVVAFLIGQALEDNDRKSAAHSENDQNDTTIQHSQEGNTMTNVFEQNRSNTAQRATLSHSAVSDIVDAAKKAGSFKEAFLQNSEVLAHAQTYGIENIDLLFPDAKSVSQSPELIARRTEWVANVINGTKHSPFAKIKSLAADLTADEARAKGYVKGNLKKDEIIKLLRRTTGPTTIYKKQKLDRDDVVDIVDLDVVAWLKGEMRLLLEEELAGAILIGDGRASDDPDKIDEDHVRPIAYDADMYAHQLVVASELSPEAVIESILRSRTYYKGTGTPTLYTTDAVLTDLLLIKDRNRRRVYNSEQELAQALRVKEIVPVEIMDRTPDVVAIIVNLVDYTVGADQGGNISMFDDFDIDFNQLKYLIETRVSGALTKPKSALVIKRTLGTVVAPVTPSFDGTTNTITIPDTTGVAYSVDGVTKAAGPLVIDEPTEVEARPASGFSFPANSTRNWTYVPSGV